MVKDANFHENYRHGDIELPSDRSTGLVFTAVSLIVAVVWRQTPDVMWAAAGVAAVLFASSLLIPKVLRPLNIVWFRFGLLLHRIVNPVVMLVLFAVVIVPAGFVMQAFRDPLKKKRDLAAVSYWVERGGESDPPSSMTNQF